MGTAVSGARKKLTVVIADAQGCGYLVIMVRTKAFARAYGAVALVALLLAAGVIYLVARGGEARTELQLPGGGTAEVAPTEKMRVRTAETRPEIDPADYTLTVGGKVERALFLSYSDLLVMEAEEMLVDLPCVEGWTETALWKGVRLSRLLDMAGVMEGADNVVFASPGGYTTSLTLHDIEKTEPLLAYEVNGEPLPGEQGFPVRLVVPGRLGYKWIKWLTSVEVISGEYEGYWESRGYSNQAEAP